MTGEISTPYADEPSAEELLAPDFEYQLLVGHTRTDGTFKTTEQLQTEYIRLTDEIIRKVTDGVEVVDKETGERGLRPVDYIVWLDKSARPVMWLTHELWPYLAADSEGNIPPEPQHRFVNIDRNQWTSKIDPEGRGISDVNNIDQSIIRSLRSIFVANPRDREEGLTEAIDSVSTQFDNKTVLIVDEVLSSGRTLDYAIKFFERAFPEANVAGTHWMGKLATKGQAVGNADLPVWYSDKTPLGRGVGDRHPDASLNSKNRTQQLGAYFLSTALTGPDPLSTQLRREMHQLAEDAQAGKVFIEPSIYRTEDDYDERALRFNHLNSLPQYIAQKRQHGAA